MVRGEQDDLLRVVASCACFHWSDTSSPVHSTSWALPLGYSGTQLRRFALKSSLVHVRRFSGSALLITSGFSPDPNNAISLVNSLATRNLTRIATKMTPSEAPC